MQRMCTDANQEATGWRAGHRNAEWPSGPARAATSPEKLMPVSQQSEIDRYLCTGQHDALYSAWPGRDLVVRARQGDADLRRALIDRVRSRTRRATAHKALEGLDVVSLTRAKVEPMVRGLFPRAEQQAVFDMLAPSVIFLVPAIIETVLNNARYLGTTWHLANLYLASCDADLLSDEAVGILGLSEGTTCFVSMTYFQPNGQLDDFLVHEAAHVFHNCKRATIGLPEIRGGEWLLEIDFCKRETFAYACETYSRILALGESAADRRRLLTQAENGPMPPDDRLDAAEYIETLRAAVGARNGWKRIHQVCAPPSRRRDSNLATRDAL
jgi:hypothetical protein